MGEEVKPGDEPTSPGRRDFLSKAGKAAIVTPPAITLLLSTSLKAEAVTRSANGGGGKHREKRPKAKVKALTKRRIIAWLKRNGFA